MRTPSNSVITSPTIMLPWNGEVIGISATTAPSAFSNERKYRKWGVPSNSQKHIKAVTTLCHMPVDMMGKYGTGWMKRYVNGVDVL